MKKYDTSEQVFTISKLSKLKVLILIIIKNIMPKKIWRLTEVINVREKKLYL